MFDISRTFRKLIFLLRRSTIEKELAEEMETHRSLLAEPQGMGNMTIAKEESRDVWAIAFLESLLRDTRHAVRGFLRSPGFTATAVISLALGIGANTAIFSFVNAILLKQLPVRDPQRLVTFSELEHGEKSQKVWRLQTVNQMAQQNTSFSGLFGRLAKPVNFSAGDSAHWLMGELVTGQYFQTLQVKAAIGRLFNDADVRNAVANPVCVLSYQLWQSEFAGDPATLQRTVYLNGHAYHVLGVTEQGFFGDDLHHRLDVQIPATRIGDFMPSFGKETGVDGLKTLSWLTPMAHLKPAVTMREAQDQIRRVSEQVPGGDKRAALILDSGAQGFSSLRADFAQPVLVLMAVAALVLLIACANLANLLLARAQTRSKEFAVRMSIGASRGRLITQLFGESLLLAACGGGLGVLLSFSISRSLLAFLNSGKSSVAALHVSPDARVLAFAVGLSFLTAVLFGLVPAWQATRPDLLPGLKQDLNNGRTWQRLLLRRGLVSVQIALSLVVIFIAGLLTQTLRALKTRDLGFQPDQVLVMNVDPAASGHSSTEVSLILDQILSRARALPGVQAASLAASTPNGSFEISMSVDVPGYVAKEEGDTTVAFNAVSTEYFRAMGQRLLQGRTFTDADSKNAPRVAIVNGKFVRHYLNGQNVVGRKFKQGGGNIEIAGVVQDSHDYGVRSQVQETVYVPDKQSQNSGLSLLVRSRGEPSTLIPSLLAITKSIDPRTPVYSVRTLDSDLDAELSTERILGYLSTLFGAIALLLAAAGIYGIVAYSVVRRTSEIGIRYALGALGSDVALLFAKQNLALLLVGAAFGVPVALFSGKALQSLLFEVAPADPLTLFISFALLVCSTLAAMALPLWRAAQISPIAALRYD
jgi:predicted permease